ncbi:MAG: TonB-dependent receptor [Bacteroidota bacterium]
MRYIFTCFLFLVTFTLFAQDRDASIYGSVSDAESGEAIDFVTVYIEGTNFAVNTNPSGFYRIKVPSNQPITIAFSRTGYRPAEVEITGIGTGKSKKLDIALASLEFEGEVIVTESKIEEAGIVREEVTELKLLPTTTGNLESVLPSIALGVSSGTGGELSSQYNVRGGNYDENLIYVNDFEIYRPQLIRSGQQEGLTFANIDLISNLSFSSGGFQAKYGDKLSSVLDVQYKRPDKFKASVGASFLGGSAHVEGSTGVSKKDDYRKFRYLVGARYKTTRYLLGTLDTQGEYIPNFGDIQAYLTYDISRDLQLGIIGNYNRSEYSFIPTERSTALGLIDFTLELFSVFEGQEVDDFTTGMGGISLTYLPDRKKNPIYLKLLTSTYQSNENERFDILGFYRLGEINTDISSDNFGEVVNTLGTGTQHQFVRNSLQSNVSNIQHKGGIEFQLSDPNASRTVSHFLQWSARYQREEIDDKLNEWERLDSAGYSLPYDPNTVQVANVLKTKNNLLSSRFTASLQNTYSVREKGKKELQITAGIRAAYWDLNQEFFITPRAQLLYKPLGGKKDISYRLAAGLYYQSPFYRELRRLDGSINRDLQSQKSLHVVGGFTYDFFMKNVSKKPFRLIMEAYYKRLWDLVSYDVDNVRIRYSGENDATGYVAGLDMRINGEFVPGAESWINLSLLRARESLDGVQHQVREIGDTEGRNVADVPRPTDQFLTLAMFFQDYLPGRENFKMHLNFTVGTGLPYGLRGNNEVFRNTYRFRPYHRVDLGFSLGLWDKSKLAKRPKHFLRATEKTWLSLEVFNLMDVQNVASNTWIKTVFSQQYAVPNFLSSRRINLRLKVDF